jgi:hypothetical protein
MGNNINSISPIRTINEIDNFFSIIKPINKEVEEYLSTRKNDIYREFGSINEYINYFDNLTLDDFVVEKRENGSNYLSDLKIDFLIKITLTLEQKSESLKLFRVMRNEPSEMKDSSWFYSWKKGKIACQRLNKEGEKLLYVSTCANIAIQETIKKNENVKFSLIEYEVDPGFSYTLVAGDVSIVDEMIYRDVISFTTYIYQKWIYSELPINYEKIEYYEVINDLIDKIKDRDYGKVNAVAKVSINKECYNSNCEKHSIAVYEEFEKLLSPTSIEEMIIENGEISSLRKISYSDLLMENNNNE